jgi:acetylornithine aminotransferase
MTNVFFCNTGLEANEAALKIARKYGHDKGIESPRSWSMKAFHGRSIATCRPPATPRCRASARWSRASSACRSTTSRPAPATEGNPNVVAVFFETIQGEGGINPMRADYLQQVRQLDERGWLLMIDEVQCGMGRTGKWFAHQWAGIVPDVMPWPRAWARACPPWWRAPRPPTCCNRATTAPPSAATRWPCAPAWKPSASWKKTACCRTPPPWAHT